MGQWLLKVDWKSKLYLRMPWQKFSKLGFQYNERQNKASRPDACQTSKSPSLQIRRNLIKPCIKKIYNCNVRHSSRRVERERGTYIEFSVEYIFLLSTMMNMPTGLIKTGLLWIHVVCDEGCFSAEWGGERLWWRSVVHCWVVCNTSEQEVSIHV